MSPSIDNIAPKPKVKLFHPRELYPEPLGPKCLKLLTIFIVGFSLGYSFLNFPALWKNFSFRLAKPQGVSLKRVIVKTVVGPSPNSPSFPPINPFNPSTSLPYNTLVIDSIAVNAPITWNSQAHNITNDLKKGVAHIEGTSLPGGQGSVFITGHSSDFWWNEGDFKTVFALLPEIQKGAKIQVFREGKEYNYQVSEIKVVSSSKVVDFLDKDKENLVLMTCYPLGTSFRRLLVKAEPLTK